MAEYSGLLELQERLKPRAPQLPSAKVNPMMPAGTGPFIRTGGGLVPMRTTTSVPYNPSAALTVMQTPKSQSQNVFLDAIKSNATTGQATSKNSLTNFVRQAYAQQQPDKAALDQETKFLNKIFATEGGLVDELASARAKRQAGVMMRVKMAMDRAGRANNARRMIGGNSSFNDRAYRDTVAGIAANEAIGGAERESDDLRYLTGVRSGALGARGRLGREFTESMLLPAQGTNMALRDDASVLREIAGLENQNSIYETPLEQLRREIAMRQGLSELDAYSEDEGYAGFPGMAGGYRPPIPSPMTAPIPMLPGEFGQRFRRANTPPWRY